MASTPSSSGRSPTAGANVVLSYRMHVSQMYLDLTKQKLNLTRLPRDPQSRQRNQRWDLGLSKAQLEPLVDHWMEEYDWRSQEAHFNDTLPQYRVVVHGTRLHYVHRPAPAPTAIPLLFVHGWPESFIAVSNMIDQLNNPVSTPPRGGENVPAFHVVAPSIPGFGFSDQVHEEGNNIAYTAELFDALMKCLGYTRYIVTGSGWGFKICRLMALTHSESCVAIHTANPEVPEPSTSFGYNSQGLSPPLSPGTNYQSERPQTIAYALCDSPTGLLAYIVDSIRPQLQQPDTQKTPTASTRPTGLQNPWTPTALINWTMLYWLPGPEVALRWLNNSAPFVPNLWTTYSDVPLAISQFSDPEAPQAGPVWAEAYHRIAMVRRRGGNARFPAWERPNEMVMDIRDLAALVWPCFFGTFGHPSTPIGH